MVATLLVPVMDHPFVDSKRYVAQIAFGVADWSPRNPHNFVGRERQLIAKTLVVTCVERAEIRMSQGQKESDDIRH